MWELNTRGWVLKVYFKSIQYNIIMVSGEYTNLKLVILMYIIIINNIIQ